MLRLKLALEECGIKQKALCDATGFGKTQVSLTLSTGKLPANAEKFLNGVSQLVDADNRLIDWLVDRDLTTVDLCDIITDPDQASTSGSAPLTPGLSQRERSLSGHQGSSLSGVKGRTLPLPTPATLPRLLCDIAGRAVLNDSDDDANEMIIQLARTVSYLHREMAILVGYDAPWMVRTEAEAAAILKGDSHV